MHSSIAFITIALVSAVVKTSETDYGYYPNYWYSDIEDNDYYYPYTFAELEDEQVLAEKGEPLNPEWWNRFNDNTKEIVKLVLNAT